MTFDLASLGWDATLATAYRPLDAPGVAPVRVLRVDCGIATVLGASGTARASLAGAQLARAGRDPLELPAAGDWAAIRTWRDRRVTIEALLTRRTQVVADGVGRPIAANLDVLAVVEPIDTTPDLGRIERLLSLAWDSGARPIVLLTEADRARGPEVVAARVARATPALEVIAVSTRTGRNLARVRAMTADGQTLGLIGGPSAGRAALVTALAGGPVLDGRRIGPAATGSLGVSAALLPLASGGAIMDISDDPLRLDPALRPLGKNGGIGLVDGSA